MANISISQMNTRAEANLSDLHEVAYADSNSQTGYASGKMTMEVMANAIVNGFTYQSLGNKKISKAIEDAEVTVDTALDPTSTNAVQNRAIAHELAGGNTQASGDVVTISDGSNLALTSATTTLTPIQDLHGYNYPWIGGAGKNLLDYDTWKTSNIVKGTAVWENNGVTLTATNNDCYISTGDKSRISVTEGQSVTISWEETTNKNGNIYILPNGGNAISVNNANVKKITYTPTSGITYIEYSFGVNIAGDTIAYKNIQIEYGTQATAYEPYSNICPISGYDSAEYTRTGKNILPINQVNQQYNTGITCNIPAGSYTMTYNAPNGKALACRFYYVAGDNDQSVVLTSDERTITFDRTVVSCNITITNYSAGTTVTDIQLEQGTTATTYQPYQGQAVTLTFEDTIYSGVIDWCNGVVTVDKGMVDLGSLTWAYGADVKRFLSTDIANVVKRPTDNDTIFNGICSQYRATTVNILINDVTLDGIIAVAGTTGAMSIRDLRYTDAPTFTTAMDGVQLLYELATPTTIQLTPTQLKTLAGYNTIYTNVGNISIAYQPNNVIAECKEYTDNAIPTVDSELDDTSLNPIANKPVAEAIADIVGDISDIDSNIEGSKQLTTTGNVITVSDSAATYLEELEVDIEPKQDLSNGDPSPTNICPITGYDDVSVQTTDEEETTTNTITATFDNTIYSGHVDFTNGVVTVDKGYIASYNGETLTGAWISDRDVYTSGGTPTTGAEVVYELATPQTIQLTPQQLQMLKGYNTVTTDANGGMTIKYQPDNVVGEIKAYASRLYDDILDRLEALSE